MSLLAQALRTPAMPPPQKARFTAIIDEVAEVAVLTVTQGGTLEGLMMCDHTFDGTTLSDHARHCYFFEPRLVLTGDTVRVHTHFGTDGKRAAGFNYVHDLYWRLGNNVWNNTGDRAQFRWVSAPISVR